MTNQGRELVPSIVAASLCSGCGGCTALFPNRIEMQVTDQGYLRPRQERPLSREEESLVAEICPGVIVEITESCGQDDVLWGPYVQMRTGWAKDAGLRHSASSGGALSALLVHLLESGEVDAIHQVTSDPEYPVANRNVLSRNAVEIRTAAGSRYAPSAPLAGLDQLLEASERYAFVGKPCDVSALRRLARRDTRVNERFPYMISFFCAGVPSLDGAQRLLEELETHEGQLRSFRYRGNGWPGYATAVLKDGTERSMTYAESWGRILSGTVQFRCKICPDGTGSFADVVCADAWETDIRGYPVFEESDGISLIVSRTEKGETLVQNAIQSDHLDAEPFDKCQLAAMQPGQVRKRRLTLARIAALRMLGRPIPHYAGFHLLRNAVQAGSIANARNLLGTLRRALKGRL